MTDDPQDQREPVPETPGPGLFRPTATIEAMRFTGGPESATAIIDWLLSRGVSARYHGPEEDPAIGEHIAVTDADRARPGEWLVRGLTGKVWSVADAHFRKTYRPADAADHLAKLDEIISAAISITTQPAAGDMARVKALSAAERALSQKAAILGLYHHD